MAEVAPIKTYYAWVIASSSEYAEQLVAKLIKRGFTVGPLGRQLITTYDGNAAAIIAMSIYRTPRNDQEKKEWTATGVHAEVSDVIKVVKGKFWGLIVASTCDCTWNTGNIHLNEEEVLQAQLKKVN